MSQDKAARMEAMLRRMRQAFLEELPGRCDELEQALLSLEAAADGREAFDELYRQVHSIKGVAGTYGLPLATTLCHHFETLLSSQSLPLHARQIEFGLRHVDLLRWIGRTAATGADPTPLETEVEALRLAAQGRKPAVLVAEPSLMMRTLYVQALDAANPRLTVVDDGLTALEHLLRQPYDLAILAGELSTLSGLAVAVALRLNGARNHDIPLLLISSQRLDDPGRWNITLLPRDQALPEQLRRAAGTYLSA